MEFETAAEGDEEALTRPLRQAPPLGRRNLLSEKKGLETSDNDMPPPGSTPLRVPRLASKGPRLNANKRKRVWPQTRSLLL